MKKTFVFLALAAVLATACTKNSRGSDDGIVSAAKHGNGVEDNPNGGGGDNTTSVPPAVLSAFNSRYPDASNIQWKKQSDGTYKAEFFRGTVKWQATFTAAGVLVKEEHN
jgi:hypothetical protein